jgi:hypothetical protein
LQNKLEAASVGGLLLFAVSFAPSLFQKDIHVRFKVINAVG